MNDFNGKVALVTGGGSGIGAATAKLLAARGAKVAILDLRADRSAAVAAQIIASGGQAIALPPTDIANEQQMREALVELMAQARGLDIVIANAGMNGMWAPIDDLTPEEWDRSIAVNLRGAYLTLHLSVPHLKAAGGGAVVVVTSITGTSHHSMAGASAYAAAKAGQVALVKQTALELARHQIRVNAVAPGWTQTHIDENTSRRNTDTVKYPAVFPAGMIPLRGGSPAPPEDVAETVVMLASPAARHVTGTVLVVDGGESLIR